MSRGFWLKSLKGDQLEDLVVNGNNIENYPKETELDDVEYIYLVQDMNKYRAVVNSVMNLRIP
jgi:hypothetical protein